MSRVEDVKPATGALSEWKERDAEGSGAGPVDGAAAG
jgi:hypothetical protein